MTREVTKICEKRAPWDKSNHYRIHAVLYSNTFKIVDDVRSFPSWLLLMLFFFFARVSLFIKATQCPGSLSTSHLILPL